MLTPVDEINFEFSFRALQRSVYETNAKKGFNQTDHDVATLNVKYGVPTELVLEIEDARTAQKIALIHAEMSEGLEAVRKHKTADDHIPEFTGLEAELADAVIRIMNLATKEHARLAEAIIAKAKYNDTRPFKHGGKAF